MSGLSRWRLVLGRGAEGQGLAAPAEAQEQLVDQLLEFLFGPGGSSGPADSQEEGSAGAAAEGQSLEAVDPRQPRSGCQGGPTFTVPEWVRHLRQLFPPSAKTILEKELIRRRGIQALLQEPHLLQQVEPNLELVKVLLNHKSLLSEHTRPLARRLIEKVVQQIKERLKIAVEPTLMGALRRDRHSPRPAFRNLDLRRTIWRNLQHYDAERQRLLVDHVFYFAAERKRRPWHIITVVDQSGSMSESTVFSAVMASIFAELPSLRASLIAFAGEVADLSDQVRDPVEVLMSVQVGGGTDIDRAMRYAAGLVREPKKTILVLISDFEEGGNLASLLKQTELLADAGVRLIGLGALSYEGRAVYSQSNARLLAKAGMDILACNPEQLAECLARIIRG